MNKYGLVYPGVGWVVWRGAEYLPQELVFNINYLGADQSSFTLNFSKGASQVIGQYYQLIRLGKKGYRAIIAYGKGDKAQTVDLPISPKVYKFVKGELSLRSNITG